jgi:predicted GNAT family acetyltransferase
MEVVRRDDAAAFLAEAEPLLLADEARHNLLFGIAGNVRDGLYGDHRLWLVREGGRPVGAAVQTPPFNLVLAKPASDAALVALVDALGGEPLPGVTGGLPEAQDFAARWSQRTGATTRTSMAQGIYELERVELPPRPNGEPRLADEGDRDLIVGWFVAFADEVDHAGGPRGPEHAASAVDRRYAVRTSGFLLWEEDGKPVSLAGWGGPTPHGIRIGPVYTPPNLRGRGYATALTAELSQRLLDGRLFGGGRRFCFLYTDLANPTSNAIYERIGYRRVARSAEIVFG